MIRISIKAILFLFGVMLFNPSYTPTTFVASVLLTIFVVAINHYLNRRIIAISSSMLFYGLCFFFPLFLGYLPVITFMLMEALYQHRPPIIHIPREELAEGELPFIDPWASTSLYHRYSYTILVSLPIAAHLTYLRYNGILLLILMVCIAAFLHYMSVRYESLQEKYIVARDNNQEYQLKLLEQNQSLIQNQEADIHLATLKERNRIAREIHDNVGHLLTRAILQMGLIQALNQNEMLTSHVDSLMETLDSAMNNIRESVHDLRDDSISLREAVRKMTETLPCELKLDYSIESDVPNQVKYCFLGILKEGITNISKHSDATMVDISIKEHPGLFQLLIHDNGTVKPNLSGRGMGIENMEERVHALGGQFHTSYHDGFRIFVSIPKGTV